MDQIAEQIEPSSFLVQPSGTNMVVQSSGSNVEEDCGTENVFRYINVDGVGLVRIFYFKL